MGIRFLCPNGHKLNVKNFLAGKRGICPDCDARFLVPFESGGKAEALDDASTVSETLVSSDESSESTPIVSSSHLAEDVWHVRTATGNQLGPATTSLLKTWVGEKRINQDCWVWKTGWLDWQRASDVFPEIGSSPGTTNKVGVAISTPPPSIATDQFDPQESVAVATHRRLQRERRQRARNATLALFGLICLLALVLLIVVFM